MRKSIPILMNFLPVLPPTQHSGIDGESNYLPRKLQVCFEFLRTQFNSFHVRIHGSLFSPMLFNLRRVQIVHARRVLTPQRTPSPCKSNCNIPDFPPAIHSAHSIYFLTAKASRIQHCCMLLSSLVFVTKVLKLNFLLFYPSFPEQCKITILLM